jgi:hypothetical protein
VLDKKTSRARHAMTEKQEFTLVNEHFSGEHNADIGHYGQTLNQK